MKVDLEGHLNIDAVHMTLSDRRIGLKEASKVLNVSYRRGIDGT